MAVLGFLFYMMGKTVFEPLDQGKFREASDKLLIWGVLGLIFMFIAGIFLLLAYVPAGGLPAPVSAVPYPILSTAPTVSQQAPAGTQAPAAVPGTAPPPPPPPSPLSSSAQR